MSFVETNTLLLLISIPTLCCRSSFYITSSFSCFFFFFNDTATTEIYTLSLHDALPISRDFRRSVARGRIDRKEKRGSGAAGEDRKSTRLNSSHVEISYAVFCLKKKKKKKKKKN